MGNVRQFSIELDAFGKNQMKVLSQLLRRGAFMIMSDLVKGSPVDTGRFRGSWFVGIGHADRSVISDKMIGAGGSAGETRKQKERRQRKNTRLTSPESMSRLALLTPETVTGRDPIILSNNLPYGEALANGHSKQAPKGWITAAVARAARELNVIKVVRT